MYHSEAGSACPGCGGENFKEKHPSCGCFSCCAVKHGYEVCSECSDYKCERLRAENVNYDSFVTHKKMFENLDEIKNNGMVGFIERQKVRIDILKEFISNYNDGRSKSFFCVSSALLPLDKLQEINQLKKTQSDSSDLKAINKQLKALLKEAADELKIELKLTKKEKS